MPLCLRANRCLFWHRSNVWFLLALYLIPHWYFLYPLNHTASLLPVINASSSEGQYGFFQHCSEKLYGYGPCNCKVGLLADHAVPLIICHWCPLNQGKKLPTTSWSNWSKGTIKLLFYQLSLSLIIQAVRVELYFITIETSIRSCTSYQSKHYQNNSRSIAMQFFNQHESFKFLQ